MRELRPMFAVNNRREAVKIYKAWRSKWIVEAEDDYTLLVVAAALLELFSLRTEQPAPEWTRRVGPVEQPLYLLKSATHMRRLRELCRDAAPEPLRRRRLYAPPDYLTFA